MRLEGTLDAFSLPDIFQLLSFTKKSGALHLRRTGVHGVVHFANGSVTGASSDENRRGLARRLAGTGAVPEDAFAAAVERSAADPNVGVAAALRDAGAVDEGTLHGLVAEQTVDAVFDLLRWPDGEFAFVVEQTNPDDLGLALPVEETVEEARRRLEYWHTVSRTVPSPDSVAALAPHPAADPAVSREEWALLGLVDGRRTVAEVVALTGRGEYAVVSCLAGLVDRGLVAVHAGPGAADADAAAVLARRQRLLARLEGADAGTDSRTEAAEPAPAAPQAARVPAPAVPAPPADPAPAAPAVPVMALAHAGDGPAPGGPPAAVPAPVGLADASYRQPVVTPARPEPFLPRRRPDHPEDQALNAPVVPASMGGSMGSVGQVHGNAAVAADPAVTSSIERDPSVNKSLLLRLIAGVRGL